MKPVENSEQEEQLRAIVQYGRDYGKRVVHLKGGPLDGQIHEIEAGWPCPDVIGQALDDGTTVRYLVDHASGTASFKDEP